MYALLLTAVLPAVAGAGPISPEQVSTLKAAVVRIKALDAAGDILATGSGFLIDARGVVATNRHVAHMEGALVAELADGSERKIAGILVEHPKRDVALVKIDGEGYPALQLGSSERLLEGTPIVMVGAPLGLGWTVSAGSISALRPHGLEKDQRSISGTYDDPGGRLLQLDVSSAQGASGSPVVDSANQVIGIVSSGMGPIGNLVFAIPVEAVKEAAEGVHGDLSVMTAAVVDASARTRYRNLGVSLAFFAACAILLAVRRKRSTSPRPRRT